MTNFFKGQKVRRINNDFLVPTDNDPLGGVVVGEVYTVSEYHDTAYPEIVLEGHGGYRFSAGHFEPAFDRDAIKPGDTVTLSHPDGTHLPNRVVSSVYAIMIGRRQEYLNDLYEEGYTLTDHHQPVDFEPGTVYDIETAFGEEVRAVFTEAGYFNAANDIKYRVEDVEGADRLVVFDPATVRATVVEAVRVTRALIGARTEAQYQESIVNGVLSGLGIEDK